MKKGFNQAILVDYLTIIIAFFTLIASLVIYNAFNYRIEARLYIIVMIASTIVLFIGYSNLFKDDKRI